VFSTRFESAAPRGRRAGLLGLLAVAALVVIAQPARGAALYAPDVFVREDINTRPTPAAFSVCHGGTCSLVSQVGLADADWRRISAVFDAAAPDAGAERAQIAEAIARFETVVGRLTDTSDDRAENRLGKAWWSQMDCIDESTNTTTYLRILAQAGLLRWHRVEARATRGWFLFGWPHTTAVISETGTAARWAVDSWFHDNGRPPEIVPLELWRRGWRPGRGPATEPASGDERR
jgi:hypothetical protein